MKTYIWSLPTRIFHWLLVISLVAAYALSEEEELLNLHTAFGYAVGFLVVFRLIWGFMGPRYSKFKDFPIEPGEIREFFTDMRSSKLKHVGHNPLASWVMIGIIIVAGFLVLSGILMLAEKGVASFGFIKPGISEDTLKEVHETTVSILVALVIIHLLGLIVEFLTNRKMGTVLSIISGYKNVQAEPVQLTTFQRVFSIIVLALAFAVIPYSAGTQNLSSLEKSNENTEEIHDEEDDD